MAVCLLFRLGVRQEAIKKLINALPNDAASISQPAVTSLLLVLLSATHANDVSLHRCSTSQFIIAELY